MEIFMLYLLTRLDAVQNTAIILAWLCGAAAVICVLASIECLNADTAARRVKYAKRWALIALVPTFVAIITPTQKDMAFILAGWGVIEVAKSEAAQRVASKSVQIIEQTLDGYLNETKGE